MEQNTQNIHNNKNKHNKEYVTIIIHNLQNETEPYKTHNYIYNYTKLNQKTVKKCGKRNSHITSELNLIHTHTHTHT